jgi:hypothetical protein
MAILNVPAWSCLTMMRASKSLCCAVSQQALYTNWRTYNDMNVKVVAQLWLFGLVGAVGAVCLVEVGWVAQLVGLRSWLG